MMMRSRQKLVFDPFKTDYQGKYDERSSSSSSDRHNFPSFSLCPKKSSSVRLSFQSSQHLLGTMTQKDSHLSSSSWHRVHSGSIFWVRVSFSPLDFLTLADEKKNTSVKSQSLNSEPAVTKNKTRRRSKLTGENRTQKGELMLLLFLPAPIGSPSQCSLLLSTFHHRMIWMAMNEWNTRAH